MSTKKECDFCSSKIKGDDWRDLADGTILCTECFEENQIAECFFCVEYWEVGVRDTDPPIYEVYHEEYRQKMPCCEECKKEGRAKNIVY